MSSIGSRPGQPFGEFSRVGETQGPRGPAGAPGEAPPAAPGAGPGRTPDAGSSELARLAFGADPLAGRLSRAAAASGRPAAGPATGSTGGASAAERPLLKYGSRGQDVRDLQQALNAYRSKMGLPSIGAEGTFGPSTLRAVTQFQRANGLEADGVVGENTWKKLLGEKAAAPEPKPGSTTARVLEQRQAIESAAEKYGVPPNLIAAIISGDLDKAIAAYNAGIGAVRQASKEGQDPRTVTYHDGYVDKVLSGVKKYSAYF